MPEAIWVMPVARPPGSHQWSSSGHQPGTGGPQAPEHAAGQQADRDQRGEADPEPGLDALGGALERAVLDRVQALLGPFVLLREDGDAGEDHQQSRARQDRRGHAGEHEHPAADLDRDPAGCRLHRLALMVDSLPDPLKRGIEDRPDPASCRASTARGSSWKRRRGVPHQRQRHQPRHDLPDPAPQPARQPGPGGQHPPRRLGRCPQPEHAGGAQQRGHEAPSRRCATASVRRPRQRAAPAAGPGRRTARPTGSARRVRRGPRRAAAVRDPAAGRARSPRGSAASRGPAPSYDAPRAGCQRSVTGR